jgi:hypothetical protein
MTGKKARLEEEFNLCLKKIGGITNALKEFGKQLEKIREEDYEEAFIDLDIVNALLDETIAIWGEEAKKRVEEYMAHDETLH